MFQAFYGFDLAFAQCANALLKSAGVFFTPLLRGITFLGELGWAFILAGLVMLCFRRTRKAGFAALLGIFLGAVFVNLILKNAVARPRPFHDESSPFYGFWVEAGSVSAGEYSFPSGHSTATAAFAAALVCAFNKKTSWLYALIPLVMGFSRIYFQVHFASDVLFGFIAGGACGVGAWFLEKLLTRWKLFERFLEAGGVVDLVRKLKSRSAVTTDVPTETPPEEINDDEENKNF